MNVPRLLARLAEELSVPRRDFLAQQLGVDPVWVEECAAADPSHGRYTAWIARLRKAGNIRLPEDADKVRDRLEQFQKLSRTSTWKAPRDILKYRTYADLVRALEVAAPGKKQAVRIAREEGMELLNENGKYALYRVTTEQAAAKHFRHTEWCVKDPVYYRQYGPPFYYLTAKTAEGEVPHRLLHFDEYQCMNPMDEAVSSNIFKEMGLDVEGLITTPADAVAYAEIHGRWKGGDAIILAAANSKAGAEARPRYAGFPHLYITKYMSAAGSGRWVEAEPDVLAGGPGMIMSYINTVNESLHKDGKSGAIPWSGWQWKEGMEAMLGEVERTGRSSSFCFDFARVYLGRRWSELERVVEPLMRSQAGEWSIAAAASTVKKWGTVGPWSWADQYSRRFYGWHALDAWYLGSLDVAIAAHKGASGDIAATWTANDILSKIVGILNEYNHGRLDNPEDPLCKAIIDRADSAQAEGYQDLSDALEAVCRGARKGQA